jgi:hypothetical protein
MVLAFLLAGDPAQRGRTIAPMSQINVNAPPPDVEPTEPVDAPAERTAAAGINLIAVVLVLAVVVLLAWFMLTGPLRGLGSGGTAQPANGGGNTNITVNNPPPQQQAPNVNVNVPQPNAPSNNPSGSSQQAPSNSTGSNQP